MVREVENMSMKEEFKMDANMKVQCALYEFERVNGIRPNRITMGYHLVDELGRQFLMEIVPIKTLEEMADMRKLGVLREYEGIPIKVDYDNPDLLEVGYTTKWIE